MTLWSFTSPIGGRRETRGLWGWEVHKNTENRGVELYTLMKSISTFAPPPEIKSLAFLSVSNVYFRLKELNFKKERYKKRGTLTFFKNHQCWKCVNWFAANDFRNYKQLLSEQWNIHCKGLQRLSLSVFFPAKSISRQGWCLHSPENKHVPVLKEHTRNAFDYPLSDNTKSHGHQGCSTFFFCWLFPIRKKIQNADRQLKPAYNA